MSSSAFFNKYIKKGYKRTRDDIIDDVLISRSGGLNPAKRRKTAETLGEAVAVAKALDFQTPFPMRSGNASGLYNLSLGGSEYKFLDTNIGTGEIGGPIAVPLGPVALIQPLNLLKLGTGSTNRIGSKVQMRSVYWSLMFGYNAEDVDPTVDIANVNCPCRMMIVYDKQTNGAAFAISDLLTTFSGVDNLTPRVIDTNSPNNLNNRDRFVVLADKRFIMQSNGPSARHIKKYKKLNTPVTYKSGNSTGVIGEITTGGLFLVLYRDTELADKNDPIQKITCTGDIRIRFQDP